VALPLAAAHPASKNVEVRWQRRQATLRRGIQAIGRTPGDLITVIQLDAAIAPDAVQRLVGTVVEAKITESAPLLLQAQVVE
jgi:hypothetical protein